MKVRNDTNAVIRLGTKGVKQEIHPNEEVEVSEELMDDRTLRLTLSSGALKEILPEEVKTEAEPTKEAVTETVEADEGKKRNTAKK